MQTIRVLSGGHGGKGHRKDQRGDSYSEDAGNGDGGGGGGDDATGSRSRGDSPGGGGGRNGLFAPVPQRPDRSPSSGLPGSSLLENSRSVSSHGTAPMRRLGGRSPSPISRVLRRASIPPNPGPWNFMDLRGETVGSR